MTKAAGVSLFAMMAMMTAHILGRKVGYPVPGAFEASEQLMVVVFAFPMAEVGLRKNHILFGLVVRKLSKKVQVMLGIGTHIVGLILFAPLTWKAWQVAWKNLLIGEYRQGIIDFPIWPFRVAIAVGFSVFVTQLIIRLVRDFKPQSP
jgi:TRAP-type C4-dicarboxylate transport system permease small subunit